MKFKMTFITNIATESGKDVENTIPKDEMDEAGEVLALQLAQAFNEVCDKLEDITGTKMHVAVDKAEYLEDCAETLANNKFKKKQDSEKWIPVDDDSMPNDGQAVLCLDEWGTCHIAWYGYCRHKDRCWYETSTEKVISNEIKWWMPLPNKSEVIKDTKKTGGIDMERLTKRYTPKLFNISEDKDLTSIKHYEHLACETICENRKTCAGCPIQECIEKLAEYEDTGLEPNEIENLKEECERLKDEKENELWEEDFKID